MPSRPASTPSRKASKSTPPAGRPRKSEPRSIERDENFDLVSVLYHALEGADTSAQYLIDAQEARDTELIALLERAQTQYEQLARSAKKLLAARLEAPDSDDDELADDEEDEEDDEDDEDDED